MARIPYATARARTATNVECGGRVAQALAKENNHPPGRLDRHQRAQVIVERGTYGDPREADPPRASRPPLPPVRPIGPRPWATKPSSAAQLGLDGTERPLPPAAIPLPVPGRQLGLDLPPTARRYRSPAWSGTVTEPPLPLDGSSQPSTLED